MLPPGVALPLIPRDKIDDVRDRTNIVDVVRRFVDLQRAGSTSWKGLCPFHGEKTPSFHVHEQRQFFHCFGCGEKGDVFTFLVKIEQRPFSDVLRDLAHQAGVDLPEKPMSPAERQALAQAESERDRMLRVMDLAARFFQESFTTPAGAAARAYVDKRGIPAAVVEKFRLGYAPGRWDALSSFLTSKQVPLAVAERLGLVGTNERGRYDFFRDRVMLPVIDRQKRVIGFSGRLLDPDAKDRKYVNSPDSPLFHKKQSLLGLHAALDAIRKRGEAVIVEGNFDVLSLHTAGIEEAVAPMGTALTAEQVAILGRMARRVVVVFDGDSAGQRAAHKVIPMFVEAQVDGRVARLPPGVDPDEFVRAQGGDAFRRLMENARPMVDQFVQDALEEANVIGRAQAIDSVAALLVKIANETLREAYVRDAAGRLQTDVAALRQAMRRAAEAPRERPARDDGVATATELQSSGGAESAPAVQQRPLKELLNEIKDEMDLLALLASVPTLVLEAEAARAGDLLSDTATRQLFRAAVEQMQQAGRLDVPAWLESALPEVREAISRYVNEQLMAGRFEELSRPAEALNDILARLRRLRIDAELTAIKQEQRLAQARGDQDTVRAITLREIELIRTKQGLKAAPQRS